MTAQKYFEKNGFVYGISSKSDTIYQDCAVYYFTDFAKARAWLHTEEYDFRERELCSKTQAVKCVGDKAVKMAQEQRQYW